MGKRGPAKDSGPASAHRNYRIYVIGNSISLIGWWLERVAVGWLTWTFTLSGA